MVDGSAFYLCQRRPCVMLTVTAEKRGELVKTDFGWCFFLENRGQSTAQLAYKEGQRTAHSPHLCQLEFAEEIGLLHSL